MDEGTALRKKEKRKIWIPLAQRKKKRFFFFFGYIFFHFRIVLPSFKNLDPFHFN